MGATGRRDQVRSAVPVRQFQRSPHRAPDGLGGLAVAAMPGRPYDSPAQPSCAPPPRPGSSRRPGAGAAAARAPSPSRAHAGGSGEPVSGGLPGRHRHSGQHDQLRRRAGTSFQVLPEQEDAEGGGEDRDDVGHHRGRGGADQANVARWLTKASPVPSAPRVHRRATGQDNRTGVRKAPVRKGARPRVGRGDEELGRRMPPRLGGAARRSAACTGWRLRSSGRGQAHQLAAEGGATPPAPDPRMTRAPTKPSAKPTPRAW